MDSLLHKMQMEEFQKSLQITVPEGVGADRRVQFKFHGKMHEVILPEGVVVGQQVPIMLTKSPALPRNGHLASRSLVPTYTDRSQVNEHLRHTPRVAKGDDNQ